MSEKSRIAFEILLADLLKLGDDSITNSYSLGKGYAAAKSGKDIGDHLLDADIVLNMKTTNAVSVADMVRALDAEIMSVNPAGFATVTEYMAELESIFDKYENRSHAWAFSNEQPFFDGFVQGSKEVQEDIARDRGVNGQDIGFTWRTSEDERVCVICEALDGEWFPLEDLTITWTAHIGCLPPRQIIATDKGDKNIEDIEIGEKVLTHKGNFKDVTKTSKRKYKGEIYKLNYGDRTLTVTPEHPVFTQRGWVEARSLISTDKLLTKERISGDHKPLEREMRSKIHP